MSIRVKPDGIVEENENRRDRAPLSRRSSALTGEEEDDKATCGYASKYEMSVSFQLRWNVEFPLGAVPPL